MQGRSRDVEEQSSGNIALFWGEVHGRPNMVAESSLKLFANLSHFLFRCVHFCGRWGGSQRDFLHAMMPLRRAIRYSHAVAVFQFG